MADRADARTAGIEHFPELISKITCRLVAQQRYLILNYPFNSWTLLFLLRFVLGIHFILDLPTLQCVFRNSNDTAVTAGDRRYGGSCRIDCRQSMAQENRLYPPVSGGPGQHVFVDRWNPTNRGQFL